jgi:hypothetical protein
MKQTNKKKSCNQRLKKVQKVEKKYKLLTEISFITIPNNGRERGVASG